jgi:diaminobutyrate-2-oxoglutarate transaminase
MLSDEAIAPFGNWESQVRSYCRVMPAVFTRARNSEVWDETGRRYIDFWSACGSLNYGHNHPDMKAAVLKYLAGDGILNGLDLHTPAKRTFLQSMVSDILEPRGLDYVMQFPGPTGTNAVEAALKLARKITGRRPIVAFSNAFHGMTLGSLALTGNERVRQNSSAVLPPTVRLPFDGYCGAKANELERFSNMCLDPSGGIELPAAFVVETVQGEGGLNVASSQWIRTLSRVASKLGALLIIDEVQTGCGRTGSFFSFERAGIQPDIVCLAKSISGLGLPMSLVLIRRALDQWEPGEHNGTFRGNNLAFVSAAIALRYWKHPEFLANVEYISRQLDAWCEVTAGSFDAQHKGLGLMRGLRFADKRAARTIAHEAFKRGVLLECCGPHQEVLKLMPPLTMEPNVLSEGLAKVAASIVHYFSVTRRNPNEQYRDSRVNDGRHPSI